MKMLDLFFSLVVKRRDQGPVLPSHSKKMENHTIRLPCRGPEHVLYMLKVKLENNTQPFCASKPKSYLITFVHKYCNDPFRPMQRLRVMREGLSLRAHRGPHHRRHHRRHHPHHHQHPGSTSGQSDYKYPRSPSASP